MLNHMSALEYLVVSYIKKCVRKDRHFFSHSHCVYGGLVAACRHPVFPRKVTG